MIRVQKLHYEVNRQLNRVHGDWKSHISVVDIDGYLNQAKEIILENYNAIVERNKTISNRLRSIEIKNYKLEKLKTTDRSVIFKFPENFYSTLNRRAKGSLNKELYPNTSCSNSSDDIFVHDTQTHKIEESLRDPKWNPDFNWRETFSNEDSEGIHVYHGNKLQIDELYIDYIKWIPDVANVSDAYGTYITADGETPMEDKHLMIDDPLLWRKITDVAIFLIKRDFDDNYQDNIQTILFYEKNQIN
jgi:hypothetical protein